MIWHWTIGDYLIHMHPIHWNWGEVEFTGEPEHRMKMFGVFSVEWISQQPRG